MAEEERRGPQHGARQGGEGGWWVDRKRQRGMGVGGGVGGRVSFHFTASNIKES